MTEKPVETASFVSSWLAEALDADPGCPILKAIAETTTGDSLDEAKLLSALKARSRPPVGGT
jgi:hypothetical protein